MGNIFGRSTRVRKLKLVVELSIALLVLKKWQPSKTGILFSWISRLNQNLSSLAPWQIILGTFACIHTWRHASLIFGLHAPVYSLYTEPDMFYSSSFSRIRWLLTALDASVLSTMKIKWGWLRHLLQIPLAVYYLIMSSKADNKVQDFRRSITWRHIRAMWEKGQHPLLKLNEEISRSKLNLGLNGILVPIPHPTHPTSQYAQKNLRPQPVHIRDKKGTISDDPNIPSFISIKPHTSERIKILSQLPPPDNPIALTNTLESLPFPVVPSSSFSPPTLSSSISTNSGTRSKQQSIAVPICHHHLEGLLFYHGTWEELALETQLVLDFPGGGFVAMDARHHAEYLAQWASDLEVPVFSVNYRKAPEHPYPAGFDDCFAAYEAIMCSQGRVLGMNLQSKAASSSPEGSASSTPSLTVALVGDSAGGNLCAGVILKAILAKLPLPAGLHLIYPALDFTSPVWVPFNDDEGGGGWRAVREEHQRSQYRAWLKKYPCSVQSTIRHGDDDSQKVPVPTKSADKIDMKQVLDPLEYFTQSGNEPTAYWSRVLLSQSHSAVPLDASADSKLASAISGQHSSSSSQELYAEETHAQGLDKRVGGEDDAFDRSVHQFVLRPVLSSRAKYAYDGVLPLKYLIVLSQAYFRNGGDPTQDIFISPLRASHQLLAHFPPTFLHVGGVDPLTDDSKRFACKLKEANPSNYVELKVIPKISHAYMQVKTFCPEAEYAVNLSAKWLRQILTQGPCNCPYNFGGTSGTEDNMSTNKMLTENVAFGCDSFQCINRLQSRGRAFGLSASSSPLSSLNIDSFDPLLTENYDKSQETLTQTPMLSSNL